MVDILAFFLLSLTALLEGCPCHTHHLDIDYSRRGQGLRHPDPCHGCPMKGLWAPWLAAGGLIRLVGRWMDTALTTLLFELAVLGLDNRERGIVLRDFDAARRHVWLTIVLKLSFWRELPWCLFALGHWSEGVARHCCRRALRMFTAQGAEANRHIITRLLLDPAQHGRRQLERFALENEPLDALPFLNRMAARMLFTPVVERWIERQHRLQAMASAAAPNAGIVHHAYVGCLKPLGDILKQPGMFGKLAVAAQSVQHPVRSLHTLDLWQHPRVQGMEAQGGVRELHRSQPHRYTDADAKISQAGSRWCPWRCAAAWGGRRWRTATRDG